MTTALAEPSVDIRRVLVVDDHELIREAVERRLNKAGGFEVVGTAGSVADAIDEFRTEQPDMVLIDHSLPDGWGTDVLRVVKAQEPSTVVVMLSAHDDPSLIKSYMDAGANGFTHKTTGSAEMIDTLRRASVGSPALDATSTARILEQLNQPHSPRANGSPLSPREAEILALVADGHTNDDIATRLFISPQTVKTHLARVYNKIGVRDRASASAKAIREGMLD